MPFRPRELPSSFSAMPKTKRKTKAEQFAEAVSAEVAKQLAARGGSPAPAPAPTVDEKAKQERADAIAAVHATSHFARRNGAPADVVEALKDKARELERG